MTESSAWLDGNTQYLTAAVAWVRAVLASSAPGNEAPKIQILPPPPTSDVDQVQRWRNIINRTDLASPQSPLLTASGRPAPPSDAPEIPGGTETSDVSAAAQALHSAETAIDPPPALVILSQRLGLSAFEQQILMLCVAMELDSQVGELAAACQQGPRLPTFALAMSIFDSPSWDALSPEHPLRYWRLIEITQAGGQPLTTSSLRVDERILSYIKGLNSLDDRLGPYVSASSLESSEQTLPDSHAAVVDTIMARLKQVESGTTLPAIQLLGIDSASKQLIAGEIARAIGLQAYRLNASTLPTQAGELEMLGRLWHRESLLSPVALYIEALTTSEVTPAAHGLVGRFLDRVDGAVFLDTRESVPSLSRTSVSVDVTKPTASEQEDLWRSTLGEAAGEIPAVLAGQFHLNVPAIQQIARETVAQIKAAPPATPAATSTTVTTDAATSPGTAVSTPALQDKLWDACLMYCRPRLEGLAQRIEPKATWDDFVLPPDETTLLRHIAEQVSQRNTVYEKWGFSQKLSRGLGISALFAGDSGTGKSMAAEVIANHLRMNLYRIDLSAVVSKFIGETETNLRHLFDNAENGGAILFFDEADALFGKRSEVKDSHDRYANIEVNYLLQRMESYRGLAILATNMKSALDPAFLRRLRFVVNFPFPAVTERKAIWQRVFPAGVPKENLDFDRLARLNIAGGHIHSVALNAAFLAARANTAVTLPLIFEAARTEFRKLEKPINEMDFRLPATPAPMSPNSSSASSGAVA